MMGTRTVWTAVIVTVLGIWSIAASGDGQPALNLASNGVAVKGYDVVAYDTEGAAVKGRVNRTSLETSRRVWRTGLEC